MIATTVVALTLVSGATASSAEKPQGTPKRIEWANQCIDPDVALDQKIKACTAFLQWLTDTGPSPADSSGEKYRIGKADFYKYRGSAYDEKGQYALAIADFTEAIHLNPMDGDAYYNRADAREDQRDYEHAIEDFTKAFAAGKTSAASRIGSIYTKKENYRLALQWFREGAAKGNANSMAMIALLYAARVVPDCDSARAWIKKAISAAENDFEKKEYSEKLRLGFGGRCHF